LPGRRINLRGRGLRPLPAGARGAGWRTISNTGTNATCGGVREPTRHLASLVVVVEDATFPNRAYAGGTHTLQTCLPLALTLVRVPHTPLRGPRACGGQSQVAVSLKSWGGGTAQGGRPTRCPQRGAEHRRPSTTWLSNRWSRAPPPFLSTGGADRRLRAPGRRYVALARRTKEPCSP
jgi:hypothetical protein